MPTGQRSRKLRPASVAAAILAGGRGRRMGGLNKAGLHLGALRIIDRQLAVLRRVADPVFVVAADASTFTEPGIRVVADLVPGAGALGGIYTAILSSPRDRTLVVACDMPFLDERLIARLAAPSAADLVVPRPPAGYEPLCATYARRCADAIHARILRGELKAAEIVRDVSVEEIGPDLLATYDPHGVLFTNVNTPHDYERALELLEREPGQREDRIMNDSSEH
jgi:molybdopterin-guanine dinucleotide biosynthesis protein A